MNKKYDWLELAEFFSVGIFFFGVISTAITQEILFSLIPLSFVILFNIINRQRHGYQRDKILEQKQQIQDLQQQLINFTNEYKAQKLELENLKKDVNRQRLEQENKTQELINSIREEVNNNKLEQEKQAQELHQSLIDKAEDYQSDKLELIKN